MTDILIIGGGIAGLSVAAHLAKDASVTLLEAEDTLGYHASGRSAALYERNYGNDVVRVLTAASFDEHHRLGVLSPRGIMLVASKDELEAAKSDAESFGFAEIPAADARTRVPILSDRLAFAAENSAAQDIDTDLLLQSYAKTVRAAGGQIVTKARVLGLTRRNGKWAARTDNTTFQADIVVNSAGAWADVIAVLCSVAPLGLSPLRRSMARLAAPGSQDVSGWPMLLGANESWYAKPDAGALIVSPAEEGAVPPQDAYADDMALPKGWTDNRRLWTRRSHGPSSRGQGCELSHPTGHW